MSELEHDPDAEPVTSDGEFWEVFGEWGLTEDEQPLLLTVETRMSAGSMGSNYAAPVALNGLPQLGQSRLVRSPGGDEALSSVAIYAPIELAGHFTLGTRCKLADGRVGAVLTLSKPDVYGVFGFVAVNVE